LNKILGLIAVSAKQMAKARSFGIAVSMAIRTGGSSIMRLLSLQAIGKGRNRSRVVIRGRIVRNRAAGYALAFRDYAGCAILRVDGVNPASQ
jgi:hypothetical protein